MARRHRVGKKAGPPAGRADARGGRIDPDTSRRHRRIDDPAPLRDRHADHGVCAPAGEGCRFRAKRDRGQAGQGREGPHDRAAADPLGPAPRPPRQGKDAPRGRFGRGLRRGLSPRCPRPQVSGRATAVGVAVCVSLTHALRRSAFRGGAAVPWRTRKPSSVRCSRLCGGRA